ncbi:MAG: hypothetical protein GEU75_01880 [Dehalococcoidia bacterium]|nr:hypothetical protein [Dehalococcoidia bacterium]
MKGTITKIVRTHGSSWGRVRPAGTTRDSFFNPASFARAGDFDRVEEGLEVEFDEEIDRANGTRAVQILLTGALPDSDFSRTSGR